MTEPARPIPTGAEIAWALATYAGRALKAVSRAAANIVISVVIVWLLFYRGALPPGPVPNPPVPVPPAPITSKFERIGVDYGRALTATYAAAATEMARAIEDGKPIGEAQKGLQESWKSARTDRFLSIAEPAFAEVLPPGTEPDSAKRAEFAKAWREFAKGVGK